MFGRRRRRRKRIIALLITGTVVVLCGVFAWKNVDFQNRLIYLPAVTIFGHTFGGGVYPLPFGNRSYTDGSGVVYYDGYNVNQGFFEIPGELEAVEGTVEKAAGDVANWVSGAGETIKDAAGNINEENVKAGAENVLEAIVNGYFDASHYIIDHTNGEVPTYEELEQRGEELKDLELPDSYEDVKEEVEKIKDANEL